MISVSPPPQSTPGSQIQHQQQQTPPPVKQYLHQIQDRQHFLRLSLSLAVDTHLLLPRHEGFGSTSTDALQLRNIPAPTAPGAGGVVGGGDGGGAPQVSPSSIEVTGVLWSLQEDKLIVRCEEARADVATTYAAFHQANPAMYPKLNGPGAAQRFRQRYEELSSDPVRMRMVHLLPDDTVTHLDDSALHELTRRSSGLFTQGAASSTAGASAGGGSVRAQALKAIQQSQKKHLSSAGGAYRKEDVLIRTIVRQGTEQPEVVCCSEDITPHSPLLRDLFNRSTDYLPGGAKRITLSELDPMWATIPDMCSVFAADNIQRFKNFCEGPTMLSSLVDYQERLKYKETQMRDEWNEFVAGTFSKRDEELAWLDRLQEDTCATLRNRLNAARQADVDAIHQIYDAHTHHEEEKIRAFYEQQRTNLELYYEREVASLGVLRDVADRQEPESLSELRASVAAIAELTHETFGPPYVPRLLMLADVLMAAELRSNCLKLLAVELSKCASNPEMNSELLRANTLRELMTLVPDTELLKVHRLVKAKGAHHRGLPLAVLTQELKERGDARAQELLRRDLLSIQNLFQRVNSLIARIKHQQAAAVSVPGSGGFLSNSISPQSPRSPASPRTSSFGGPTPDQYAAIRSAMHASKVKAQPLTLAELKRGETEEDLFLSWRELLQDILTRKLQQVGGEYNVAVLRVPRGLEGSCALLDHRRGFDVRSSFRYVSAEGQGCVVIGESNYLLYWEAQCIFVESGTRFPANLVVGMEPVASSMNAVQMERLRQRLAKELDASITAHQVSADKLAYHKAEAHPTVGVTIHTASSTAPPPTAMLKNYMPLSLHNAGSMMRERVVGLLPVDVSAVSSVGPCYLHGFGWGSEGVLYTDGVPWDIRAPYEVGDAVGISLNTLTGEVGFYKNGSPLTLERGVPWPRLRPGVAYHPVVTVYCTCPTAAATSASAGSTSSSTGATAATGSSAQASALLHQVFPAEHDADNVALPQSTYHQHASSSAAAQVIIPKARILVELDGGCKTMPSGSAAYSKGATPVTTIQRHAAADAPAQEKAVSPLTTAR